MQFHSTRFPFSDLLLIWILLLLFAPLQAQWVLQSTVPNTPQTQDSVAVIVKDIPVLQPTISADTVEHYYRLFYIYGDGGFELVSEKSDAHSEFHRYPLPPTQLATAFQAPTYTPRVYALKIYGNGSPPPPRMQGLPPLVSPSRDSFPGPIEINEIIDSSAFLELRAHADAKKNEPLVYVLAFTNPTETPIESGYLFLLFESEIVEKTLSEKGLSATKRTGNFGVFPVENVMIHTDRAAARTLLYTSNLPPQLATQYQKVLAIRVQNLLPGEEQHVFLDMTVDSAMFKMFNGKNLAEVTFTSILTTTDESFLQGNFLNNAEAALIERLQFQQAMTLFNQNPADSVYTYIQAGDSIVVSTNGDNGEVSGFGAILDVYTDTIHLVKEHDPNYLQAQACACPNASGRNKLLITLHAENDGLDFVHTVFFDMTLPDGITADDIVPVPINHHPLREDLGSIDSIHFEKLNDQTIRWTMNSQRISSVQEFGPGDPRTFVEIQFLAFTDRNPADFDDILQTCVRFQSLGNEAFCTYPVKVNLLQAGAGETGNFLACTTCEEDPQVGDGFLDLLPWWAWLLLILLLLLIILLLVRRTN